MKSAYPKPNAMGGTLIRKVIQNFKKNAFPLPIVDPVFIATSGGVDSVVLAHLLSRYGRNCVKPDLITLLHFDHQWRKESGCEEKEGVEKLAQSLGVKFKSISLLPPRGDKNHEDDAREKRNQAYFQLAGEKSSHRYIFTAHHQDDVAETLLWRFLRGEFLENRLGILFNNDPVIRPFLHVSKEEIRAYAAEEKLVFFEDPGNQDLSQMRAYLRNVLFPAIESYFPGVKHQISKYSKIQELLSSDSSGSRSVASESLVYALEQITSKLNRNLKTEIQDAVRNPEMSLKLTLPGGVRLRREKSGFFIEFPDDEL